MVSILNLGVLWFQGSQRSEDLVLPEPTKAFTKAYDLSRAGPEGLSGSGKHKFFLVSQETQGFADLPGVHLVLRWGSPVPPCGEMCMPVAAAEGLEGRNFLLRSDVRVTSHPPQRQEQQTQHCVPAPLVPSLSLMCLLL